MDGVDQYRAVGRVGFLIGRRVRKVLGQKAAGGIDRGLDILCCTVDRAVQVELQRDTVEPRPLVDVICAKPGIAANCCSSGVATEEAIVSGLAPGNCAETEIVGKSTVGSDETGNSG